VTPPVLRCVRHHRKRAAGVALSVTVTLLATAGCTPSGGGEAGRTLTVVAAASLTEPFTSLAATFEDEHPDVEVVTGFDSSATLAAQVSAGAEADVVATADPRTMQLMVQADAVAADPVVFARNVLVLVVPSGNPAGVTSITDLDSPQVDYVACTRAAPCGALAAQVLTEAGVTRQPRSLEVDVKAVLTKVLLDEADAGLVYASDAVAAGDAVGVVPLPRDTEAHTRYLAAPVAGARSPELAREWLRLLTSAEGRRVLTGAGFLGAAR
jgi:molybdate transport system substrate-binding protein